MNDNPDQALLEVLGPVSDSLAEMPAHSRALAARFVTDCPSPETSASMVWVLPRLVLRLRLQLSVSAEKTILVIFRRNAGTKAIFKSETHFGLTAPAQPLPPVPEQVSAIPCCLALPPFILGRSTEPVRLRIGPDEADVLEIAGRLNEPDRPFLTFRGLRLDGPLWPLGPFLALTRTLRDWLDGDLPDGTESLVLPLTMGELHEGRQILYQLIEAWRKTQAALNRSESAKPAASPPTLADCLATPYGLEEFSSEVELRVRSDGELAKADEDDTTQLRLRVEIRAANGGWQARIMARPPDFLVGGPTFDAVREVFASELGDDIQESFSSFGIPAFVPEIEDLIRSGGEGAMVLRVRRNGDKDTELLVLTGELTGRRVAVLLEGNFKFTQDGSNEVRSARGLKTLYAGPLAPDVPVLDPVAQAGLLSLAVAARNWMRMLP